MGTQAGMGGQRQWGRRTLLRGSVLGVAGLAAAALLGCGGDDDTTDDGAAPAPARSTPGAVAGVTDGDGRFSYNVKEATGPAKRGGTLVQGVTWNVGPMDPTKSAAGGTIGPGRGAYNGVLRFVSGPKASARAVKLEGDLAKSWQVTPDGLTYTFQLNGGVKWQNVAPVSGRAFGSADVKYAWERYAGAGAQRAYWVALDRIDVPDDSMVVVKLKRPSPDFLIPLGSRYLTIHPREIVEDGSIDRRAIGTGAMIQREAKPDQQVVFERNPDYFRGPVPLDRVEHRVMPDGQARLNAFRVGQLDHAIGLVGGLREVEVLLAGNPNLQVLPGLPINAGAGIVFNLDLPKWQDVRVRRAIQMAIDRQAIVQAVNEGAGAVVPTIPWVFLFDKEPAPDSDVFGAWWRYQPAEAKKLLQAAGAEGLAFDFIWYNYSDTGNSRPIAMMVDHLRQIGVAMKPQQLEYTQFNSQWTGVPPTYADAVDGWSANGFTPDTFFYEHLHSKSPSNRYKLKDQQIDQWAEQQSGELDPQKRREIHRKIWDRVQDQVWRVEKPAAKNYDLLQPWVRNISFTGPFGSNYSFTEITAAAQLERGWLDK